MFGRRRKKEPMTMMRFVCVVLPKALIVAAMGVYLIGGTVLYVADDAAWQAAITAWGIVTIIACIVFAAWMGIGKQYVKRSVKEDDGESRKEE